MDRVIRVLIVDDSAYIRKVIRKMLSRSPFIEVVGAACDGEEALELVKTLNPDVITLDIIMPRLDGLGFLKTQMERSPVRVIIVSIASETSERALEALDNGAVDFVHKPTSLANERIYEITDELIAKVKAVASAKLLPPPKFVGKPLLLAPQEIGKRSVDCVAIGVSTGGPQALRYLIPQLPAHFPAPVVMVLHMPIGYTQLYAQKLNEISTLQVLEAGEGDELKAGSVFLAPAGRHLKLVRRRDGVIVTHLDSNPSNTLHRPSVDVLFQSVAEVYNKRVLGVVMTGMGSDGKQGAAWIKSQGGVILTEAEESCVVYGMPLAVVEAGLSDESVPLERMAQRILDISK